MASVSRATVGNVTTYTITDSGNNVLTLAVNNNPVTGITVTYSGTNIRQDGQQMAFNLLNQIQSGILPGLGAQNMVNNT